MRSLVIYTAIFGDYDTLQEPIQEIAADLVCFTNNRKITSDSWEIKYVDEKNLSNHMLNRRYKMFPQTYFPDHEYSIYIDGNILLKSDPSPLINKYISNSSPIGLAEHHARICLYDEGKECIKQGKAAEEEVKKQLQKYQSDGFPKQFGLYAMNVILRKHHIPLLKQTMDSRRKQINTFTKRDQLSFMYVARRHGLPIKQIEENYRTYNSYFLFVPHTHSGQWWNIDNIVTKIKFLKYKYKISYLIFSVLEKIILNFQNVFNGQKQT